MLGARKAVSGCHPVKGHAVAGDSAAPFTPRPLALAFVFFAGCKQSPAPLHAEKGTTNSLAQSGSGLHPPRHPTRAAARRAGRARSAALLPLANAITLPPSYHSGRGGERRAGPARRSSPSLAARLVRPRGGEEEGGREIEARNIGAALMERARPRGQAR